ncbi:MAG: ATP-grasp domain-containing protein [Bacteroidales bacterium]|nr:ATP-grasp domain-containing protein [Bacteroidales bacterium]
MKKLAIIGSGRMAWIFGREAKEMGIESHAFSFDDQCVAKETVTEHHLVDIMNMDKVLDICRQLKIDGVVPTTELTVPVAAYVAEKMGLNGIPFDVARVVTDKYRNRQLCKSLAQLRQPAFAEVVTLEELNALNLSFPLILKPVSKGGKRGITVVRDTAELKTAFDFAKSSSGDNPVIVEEFIENGQEYSVESLSYQGEHYIIQVTEKMSSGAPHCVELGHHQPADISAEMRKKVEDAIKEGLTAIGVNNGPCHTEIKIVDNQIYLIEFNARPGGDHIAWPLTMLSTGYHYMKGIIQVAMNDFKPLNTSEFQHRYAGVYFVTTQSAYLKPIFDNCEKEAWCCWKNEVSKELKPLVHNDGYGTNFFIYCSEEGRPVK